METRILLVDDHQMLRDGLRVLLEKEEGLRVIGDASDGRQAIEMARLHSPDVIVMDIGMKSLNGIEATRQIMQAAPQARIIALSIHKDRQYVFPMLKAGAMGYLLKDSAFDELVQAIRAVLAGQKFFSQGIAELLADHAVQRDETAAGSAFSILTPREREALQLLAEGMTSKEMAAQLHVSVKTIETYRRDIMQKLDLHSVAELTRYAIREGLTSLEG